MEPIIARGRERLADVMRQSGDIISVGAVSAALQVSRSDAAKILARWNHQGWVKRLRRGHYAPVPLTALGQEQVLQDPWIAVPELFGPACIGGWSAAEHWDLTEQLFRGTCVLTLRPVRQKEVLVQGLPFSLKHVRKQAMFDTKAIWRGRIRVDVTSPAKTIIDMLDDPALGGGIRHVQDCLAALLRRDANSTRLLLEDALTLANGAIFKRLGFLAERLGNADDLANGCRARLTQGNANLDPALPCPRLIKRWKLWVPENWATSRRS